MKKSFWILVLVLIVKSSYSQDAYVNYSAGAGDEIDISRFSVSFSDNEYDGVKIAARNLVQDISEVTGGKYDVEKALVSYPPQIIVGTIGHSEAIDKLVKAKKLDVTKIKGKWESGMIKVLDDKTLLIVGSDKRGTIFAIYDLCEKIGVSPWKFWADVPTQHHDYLGIKKNAEIVFAEPVVKYRGIFLNDEAPCLSGWVKEKFPDSECPTAVPGLARGMNSNFYEHVFELLLRLKANYMWPAMWGNAFYADDTRNSELADKMGIMMGTSHHEPMARNHQEWARHRKENGPWDYDSNQKVIDDFFREGIRRAKNNEDLITIGMRGDGDTGLGGKEGHDDEYVSEDEKNIKLMERIFKNQRQIIAEETGKPAEKRQQIWALYKEVQHLYDVGLRVPDDVLILLCDDNWGNIRNVPKTQHKGGWGMYYHVDYVGAPRNTKWTNVTPIAHLWEQMNLAFEYGIDKLWILNVGDLKPMEYPIDLFLKMALDPKKFNADNYQNHTLEFCNKAFGEKDGKKAKEIMETYLRFNGRVTPEMLSAKTYNLHSGEFKEVVNEYKALELEAVRQYSNLPEEYKNAYYQLVLFPVESMSNLYEMYYAHAMNLYLYDIQDIECNKWADKVEECFVRDSLLTVEYHSMNNGKWNHMMDQIHIGYKIWNEPKANTRPETKKLDNARSGDWNYVASSKLGYISIEAEHFVSQNPGADSHWQVIPNYGRTKSAVALMPYTASTNGAHLIYKFRLPEGVESVKVHVVTNSTLPFLRREGHRYELTIGGDTKEVNYNGEYTEEKNQWGMYDIVATRVIETVTELKTDGKGGVQELKIHPIEPGMVLEKIVIDYGGYSKSHLFGNESKFEKN